MSTALWPKVTGLWPWVPELQASAFVGGMVAVFGLALLVRARRAVALLLAMVLIVVIVPRVGNVHWFAPDPSVRVMALNTSFGQASTAELAEAVEKVKPDVLSLSETNPEEIRRVGEATGFIAMNQAQPGAGGADGVVLLANPDGRLAALARTSLSPTPSLFAPLAEDTGLTRFQMPSLWLPSWHSVGSRLGAVDDRQVRIAGTHVVAPLGPTDRQAWDSELEALLGWVETETKVGNVVLMGDFNATRWHPRMRDFSALDDCTGHAAARPTWPTAAPVLRLDHILTSGKCGDAGTVAVDGTDHLAVWADISFGSD